MRADVLALVVNKRRTLRSHERWSHPTQVRLDHGEPDRADASRQRIERELGCSIAVAEEHMQVSVGPAIEGGPAPVAAPGSL